MTMRLFTEFNADSIYKSHVNNLKKTVDTIVDLAFPTT